MHICFSFSDGIFLLLNIETISLRCWNTTRFSSLAVKLGGESDCVLIDIGSNSLHSGKSTQVPSFILEDQLSKGKPCKIYCTEPRRISAISLAQRESREGSLQLSAKLTIGVSRELGEPPNAVGTLSSLVGYAIRLESNITRNTRLAYVTNGIALRMLEGGTGQGNGTAFDELTVRDRLPTNPLPGDQRLYSI